VSRIFTGHRSVYDDDTEMYWSEFVAIFDERRKKGKKSPTKMYNILSQEIGLSPATLASFYRHQRKPIQTSMDKIIPWLEREGKRIVGFASSSSSSSSINNDDEISNS
jgi:hypothetical protein